MIGIPKEPDDEGYKFNLKFDKVDPDGNPIEGATFKVYEDEACTKELKTITTVGELDHVYIDIPLPPGQQTAKVYVKETAPAPGYELTTEAATPQSVDVTAGGTYTVGSGTFENPPPPPPPPPPGEPDPEKTILKKIDARTGLPVGPATFLFKGAPYKDQIVNPDETPVDPTPSFVEQSETTDNNGYLDLQWWDPTETETYIPPGQYTVTETVPPPGYELTTEAQHIELVWDPVRNCSKITYAKLRGRVHHVIPISMK